MAWQQKAPFGALLLYGVWCAILSVIPMEETKEKIVAGFIHPGIVDAPWALCMIRSARELQFDGIASASSPRINSARSNVVTFFLDSTDGDWLWFIDTDMTFSSDTPQRLLATAKRHDAKLVAGLCFIYNQVVGDVQPNIFFKDIDDSGRWSGGYRKATKYPRDSAFPVDATGAACLLVHREVLEKMRNTYPKPYHWFEETPADPYHEHFYGPDIEFCKRAQDLGYKIFYDASIKLGHLKTVPLDETHFDAQG